MGAINLSKQTVNLSKSQVINLSKSSEGLKKVMIGLGWDEAKRGTKTVKQTVNPSLIGKLFGAKPKVVESVVTVNPSANYDLDAWICFMKQGKTVDSSKSLLYYSNKDISNRGKNFAHHCGDNLTGAGDGDDEQIIIDLDNIPLEYDGVVIGVTIYSAESRHQTFGEIDNMFVRVVDQNDDFEICRYTDTIADEYKDCYTFIVGKLYKDKGEWQFKSAGYGTKDGTIKKAVHNYKG